MKLLSVETIHAIPAPGDDLHSRTSTMTSGALQIELLPSGWVQVTKPGTEAMTLIPPGNVRYVRAAVESMFAKPTGKENKHR